MISTAVDPSAVARAVGIKTNYVNLAGAAPFLPQRIAVIGQGATLSTYATTKKQVFSSAEVGALYGYGSPLHLAVKQLFPDNGDGVGIIPVTVYPLDDNAAGVAAAGAVTYSGTQTKTGTFQVIIGGVKSDYFTLLVADDDTAKVNKILAAINGVLDMPVIATAGTKSAVTTAKWKGATGNYMPISVVGPTDTGLVFTVTAMTSGAADQVLTKALAQVGDVWETLVVNCLGYDTTTLDAYSEFGEGRWLPMVNKPLVVFTGHNDPDVADCISVTTGRTTDRTNCLLPCPGSANMPFVWVANAVGRIARVANSNPAMDFGGVLLPGINPGTDAQQWIYSQRNTAVLAGCSTVEVRDSQVVLSDTVTMYHPTGQTTPAYRYVCDIIKIMQLLFNTALIFKAPEWEGAPLIPDNQPTNNPAAKQPKAAVAAMCSMIDSLALDAILSNPAAAKKATVAGINSTNPKRLDVATTVQLSGNTNIISVDLNFGFYFGGV